MNEKLLTVSIASYNTEKTLRETVSSLFIEQKWMDKLEVIIVNDGSNDKTSAIAHELANQYPESIIVIDKQNGGYGSTINASLAIAKGKYYKLLDGDDQYETETLPNFLKYLEHAEADLVITPYYEVRDNRKLIDNHNEITENTTILEKVKIENTLFVMHEIAIMPELLRASGKNIAEHCFYTDAEYVFYCILESHSISKFSKPIYLYSLGVEGQSVSIEGIRKHYKDLPIVAQRIMEAYTKGIEQIIGVKKCILDQCILNISYHAYRSHMVLEDPLKHKTELVEFDKQVKKKYPIPYAIGNNGKLVKIARALGFHCYSLLCYVALKKLHKEISG